MALLEIENLKLGFGAAPEEALALNGVSLSLREGESICLVGESGSGKSLTALSIAQLVPCPPARYLAGSVRLNGRDVREMTKRELREIRGGVVSYIFQDPGSSLNPVFTVGAQIREMLKLHRPEADSAEEVLRLLRLVGIPAPESRMRSYPHQFSGGMQQRVMIAMAIASRPKLLVADEPTTALDVTVQAQIIELLQRLKQEMGMSILLITHNLGIVSDLAERVVVMYAGQVVEEGPALELLRRPLHPYTRALINSVPRLGDSAERLTAIPGNVPAAGAFPTGCPFHPRCEIARKECASAAPPMLEPEAGRTVRCPYFAEVS